MTARSPLPLFLAACFSATAVSGAATFLIDLGTNATSSNFPGGTWNSYNQTTVKVSSALRDSANNTTGVNFVGAGTIGQGGSPGAATFNTAAVPAGLSWFATASAPAAAEDWLYTTTSSGDFSHTYTFSNLNAGNVFSLDLISARNSNTALGRYSYSLDNGANWIGFRVVDSDGNAVTANGWDTNTTLTQTFNSLTQGYAAYRYMNASGVTLTGTTLMIRVEDVGDNGSFAGLNGIRLDVVPEPSAALLSLTGLAVAAFRRKR